MNSNAPSINQSVLNKADRVVQRPTPFATQANPKTTVDLNDNVKANFSVNPYLNTSTEQQIRKHYEGGKGSDVALTDAMYRRATSYAQSKLGTNPKDGSYPVNFTDSKEFNGSLGNATVHVKNGKIIGLYDYYNFEPKPWGTRLYQNEIATRWGYDQNGAPFRIYGGMVKKRY